jgi:6-pyruvoyltetrahydropterin/6-carboxytetrahydropterin synthase
LQTIVLAFRVLHCQIPDTVSSYPLKEFCIFAFQFQSLMIYVSRKEHFNAAHKLYNPNWTHEKNVEVFGPCANSNWHGHNFDLIVTMKGIPDPETGFVVDMKKLSTLIRTELIDKLDHKNINLDVDFMQGKLASCENLVMEMWRILSDKVPDITSNGTLHAIRLYETPRNYVEYFGETNKEI